MEGAVSTSARISKYAPRFASEYWDAIGAFVTNAVARSAESTRYDEGQLLTAASPFVLWAWQTAALPLEAEVIFSGPIIDRFVAEGMSHYTRAGRGTIRSRLTAMGTTLNGDEFTPRDRSMGKSDPVAPYSPTEVAQLATWADVQPSGDRRRSARTLLALGLGAGLFGREIIELRVRDIISDDAGILVRLAGERPRSIPVLEDWEGYLHEEVTGESPDAWAFRAGQNGANHNAITDFVARSRDPVSLQARRMRSTWLVHHLNIGTPLVPLLRAAGLKSPEGLHRFLKFADQPTDEEARVLLRGQSEPPRRT